MTESWKKALRWLAMGLLAGMASAATAQVSTTANGPYYATPSWDQKLTTNRFVILANWNNEAVLDRETGLVWQRTIFGGGSWSGANASCLRDTIGGRFGWRLPSVAELASLLDVSQSNPALPAGHPFLYVLSGGSQFWAANESKQLPGWAWFVDFGTPANGLHVSIKDTNDVSGLSRWCVRGGTADSNPQ